MRVDQPGKATHFPGEQVGPAEGLGRESRQMCHVLRKSFHRTWLEQWIGQDASIEDVDEPMEPFLAARVLKESFHDYIITPSIAQALGSSGDRGIHPHARFLHANRDCVSPTGWQPTLSSPSRPPPSRAPTPAPSPTRSPERHPGWDHGLLPLPPGAPCRSKVRPSPFAPSRACISPQRW